MSTYRLQREQILPQPIERAFSFFANAENLELLTPQWLHFEILTPPPIAMHVGTVIQYRLRVHGLPVHWTTSITDWNPPFEFVDVQLKGPYRLWHHRHRFESLGDQTRMTDEVTYRLPFGWIGNAAHRLLVRGDLQRIFDHRAQVIADIVEMNGGMKREVTA